jgi:hypothetical protein
MQELDRCRERTVLKPEGTGRVGKSELKCLELGEEDLKKMCLGTGKRSSSTENSGGQFWKRLRFTKDCITRRIRIRRNMVQTCKLYSSALAQRPLVGWHEPGNKSFDSTKCGEFF